jgi:hypothetical protein
MVGLLVRGFTVYTVYMYLEYYFRIIIIWKIDSKRGPGPGGPECLEAKYVCLSVF